MIVAAAAGRCSGWYTIILKTLLSENRPFSDSPHGRLYPFMEHMRSPWSGISLKTAEHLRSPLHREQVWRWNSAKVPLCVCVCESSLCPTQINSRLPQTVCHVPLLVCPFPNLEREQEALEMVGGTVALHTPGPFPLICYVRKLPGTRLRLLITVQSEAASARKNKNRPPHSAAKQILIEGPFSARNIVF